MDDQPYLPLTIKAGAGPWTLADYGGPIFHFSIRQLDEIRINDGRRSPNTKGVVKDEDTNHG